MNKKELEKILVEHGKWFRGEGGARANLAGANLTGANLTGANLYGADLTDAKNSEYAMAITMVPCEGSIIGWKKCINPRGGYVIVKLRIPENDKRSSGTGRKCRAEFAEVLEIIGGNKAVSNYDNGKTEYIVGQTVKAHAWGEDRFQECAPGIHFFVSKIEAENHVL